MSGKLTENGLAMMRAISFLLLLKREIERIEQLRKAVAHYGINRGEPKFLAGRRKIDNEEFEYQQQRLRWGLTPDPLDIGEYKDQMRTAKGAK